MTMTLHDLLAAVLEHGYLVHVSPKVNMDSIGRHGILSPAEARRHGVSPTFGSDDSNVAVVQLFDYSNLALGQASYQLTDLLESSPTPIREWGIIIVDATVRKHPAFINHWHVKRISTAAPADWRFYPETEVWIDAAQLEPRHIAELWVAKGSGRQWGVKRCDCRGGPA